MTSVDPERSAARARHPSQCWRLPPSALRARLAQVLREQGLVHADVAVAIIERRARDGADRKTYARRLGVATELLDVAEAGTLALDELPGPLRAQLVADEDPTGGEEVPRR